MNVKDPAKMGEKEVYKKSNDPQPQKPEHKKPHDDQKTPNKNTFKVVHLLPPAVGFIVTITDENGKETTCSLSETQAVDLISNINHELGRSNDPNTN
jgi:hypothetical protein